MALNIKDPETDRLARELAELVGEPITTALRVAIEHRLSRERARRRAVDREDVIAGIIARGRERAVLDDRTEDEILGYDEHGLPS